MSFGTLRIQLLFDRRSRRPISCRGNSSVVGACDVLSDGKLVGKLEPGRSIEARMGGRDVHLGIFPEASFFRRYREKFGRG